MIAAWMLYCSLCALGLSFAAAIAERVLLRGRGSVRLVWIGAVTLSLIVPAAALRFAPHTGAAESSARGSDALVLDQVLDTTLTVSAPIGGPLPSPGRDWRATLARYDEPLAVAWVTLSLALAFNFFGGMVTLAWMRRGWQRRVVLGLPVFVSERTGPAVVGAVSPAIVVPEWALALEPSQLALMLRHEQEHQRAGDGQLLALARLALIAMPWNVALWWQILRLRVAVELDCDARVLRDADARSYGELLLEVARPRRGPSLIGATAFAERATQLERRIRVLSRHRVRTSRAARVMATCTGLVAVTVAWFVPRPPVPARAPVSPAAPVLASAPVGRTALPAASPPRATNAERPSNPTATSTNDTTRVQRSRDALAATGRDSTRVASAPPPADTTPAPGGQARGQSSQQQRVDAAFKRLFDGITLTPDGERKARDILTGLVTRLTLLDRMAKTLALPARRDSALRLLLTSDADRALFDTRAATRTSGGARSGGPGPDSSGRGQRRGGGGEGRGRRGGGPGGGSPEAAAAMVEATFRRLFDGIQLTADQESSARALIRTTQQEILAQIQPPVSWRVRFDMDSVAVRMPAESESALIALVSNDADRAKLQSRIVIVPR